MGNQNNKNFDEKANIIYNSSLAEQYIGELKENLKNGNGTYIYGNGDRYIGEWLNDLRHGKGKFYYRNGEMYIGDWKENFKEGYGKYFYQNGERYIGYWKKNMKNGEGSLYLNDGSIFKGNFYENKKHGKARLNCSNGMICEEEWENGNLIAQTEISFEENEKLKLENKLEKKISKEKKKMSETCESEENKLEKESLNQIDENSKEQENQFSINRSENSKIENEQSEPLKKNNQKFLESETNKYESNKFESTQSKDLLSEMKSELKTIDAGYDTLSLIDQIEMFNSLNSSFLNKNIQDWTNEDVGDWLTIIGLGEYVDNFSNNHINGKIIFDISEKELKDDLCMTSMGHRKNFMKAVKHLKKFYSKNRLYSESIKNKLIKFYEKHHKQLKIGNFGNFVRNKKGGNTFIRGNHEFNDEIIQEDQNELSYRESPAPQINNEEINKILETNEKESQFSLEIKEESEDDKKEETKKLRRENSVKEKKKSAKNSVIETNESEIINKTVSLQHLKSITEIDTAQDRLNSQISNHINNINNEKKSQIMDSFPIIEKKQSSQLILLDNSIKKEMEEKSGFKEQLNESKKFLNDPNEKESSSSDSSSTSSDEDNKRNKNETLLKKRNTTKLLKTNSRKSDFNENIDIKESPLTYDQKFIMKTFKEAGIGANFLIDYKELEMIKKIGEGGYGDVYLGKWLGQEVAIKQYGKNSSKKRTTKKTTDFIKEVEVISNLRHPNIVLYMGVCINFSNYLMITEFLEGGSLFDILHKKHTKLDEDRIILVAEDIALGMNYLHDRKVLHCDLKSSNILIDSNWNIKLCDFGLSRVKSKLDKKRNKGRVGTPHWMAPEILRGEKYDESSDIYSYGMILWEMVSCETPYKGFSIPQIIGAVGFDNYQVPLPKKGNALVLKIMEKCLSRNRSNRPNFKYIVENLQTRNREKEIKNEVILELKNFFGS